MITTLPLLTTATNLEFTYSALGLAVTGCEVWEHEDLWGCVGTFPHPMCNFAMLRNVTVAHAAYLRRLSRERPYLHAYVLPAADSAVAIETMVRAGFREVYYLQQMAAPMAGEVVEGTDLIEATTSASKQAVAQFMVGQFFPKQVPEQRRQIGFATAGAMGLDLFWLEVDGEIAGGAMVSRNGGCLGLYNLCVGSKHRGRGLGKGIVAWAQRLSRTEGLPLILQCAPTLGGWYEKQGFKQVGTVRVFTLDPQLAV